LHVRRRKDEPQSLIYISRFLYLKPRIQLQYSNLPLRSAVYPRTQEVYLQAKQVCVVSSQDHAKAQIAGDMTHHNVQDTCTVSNVCGRYFAQAIHANQAHTPSCGTSCGSFSDGFQAALEHTRENVADLERHVSKTSKTMDGQLSICSVACFVNDERRSSFV
jgi:hypothetical protein